MISDPRRRRPLRHKGQVEVADDVVADLAFLFIEGEAFQGKERADHVLSHWLGLDASLGPDQAVDVEAGVPPGENLLRPFRAQKLPATASK